jgi:hypothetical protein
MKKSLLITLIILCFSKFSISQQSPSHVIANDEIVVSSWTALENSFKQESKAVLNLIELLTHTNIDKNLLKRTKHDAIAIVNYLDSMKILNNISINIVKRLEDNLSQSSAQTVVNIENDAIAKNQENIKTSITHLEGTLNKVATEKRNFREICINRKRKDLLYPKDKNDIGPEVKF